MRVADIGVAREGDGVELLRAEGHIPVVGVTDLCVLVAPGPRLAEGTLAQVAQCSGHWHTLLEGRARASVALVHGDVAEFAPEASLARAAKLVLVEGRHETKLGAEHWHNLVLAQHQLLATLAVLALDVVAL